MTNIFEISAWSDVASFFIWTLAVCAIAKALFGSLPAAEIQYRLALRDAPKRQRVSRLNWEINNRARWSEDVAKGSPHAAKVPLADSELEPRRHELARLTRNSLWRRALTYFMGCFACQTFWTAILVYALTAWCIVPIEWIFSAAAYSGAAVMLVALHGSVGSVRPAEHASGHAGCKGCGK